MKYLQKIKSNSILWIIILVNLGLTQGIPVNLNILNSIPSENSFTSSILNPNRLTTNQSFSFIASSSNGMSQSMGMFSNNFQYRISDQMNINSNIHLISPMIKTMNNQQSFDIKYDVMLDYKISESFRFNLMVSNYNMTNYYNYSNQFRSTNIPE